MTELMKQAAALLAAGDADGLDALCEQTRSLAAIPASRNTEVREGLASFSRQLHAAGANIALRERLLHLRQGAGRTWAH